MLIAQRYLHKVLKCTAPTTAQLHNNHAPTSWVSFVLAALSLPPVPIRTKSSKRFGKQLPLGPPTYPLTFKLLTKVALSSHGPRFAASQHLRAPTCLRNTTISHVRIHSTCRFALAARGPKWTPSLSEAPSGKEVQPSSV